MRRWLLLAAVAWLLPAGAAAQVPTTRETITFAGSSTGFTATTISTTFGQMNVCRGVLETAPIRIAWDGTAPTATAGQLVEVGQMVVIRGNLQLRQFRGIRTGSTSGVIQFHCDALEAGIEISPATGTVLLLTPDLVDATVDETAGAGVGPDKIGRCREHVIYVDWGTGVTAGVVEAETAYSVSYAGTWGPQATATFAGTAPNITVINITGALVALRTRVSTTVANGTVDTYIGCN